MNKKNLEKAVLLTVMMMALDNSALAAEIPHGPIYGSGTITTSKGNTTVISGINDNSNTVIHANNSGTVVAEGEGALKVNMTVEGNKAAWHGVYVENNSTVNLNNTGGTQIVVQGNNTLGSYSASGIFIGGKLTADSLLDINVNNASTRYNVGIWTQYDSNIKLKDANITVTSTGTNYKYPVVKGIWINGIKDSSFTADNLTITATGNGLLSGIELSSGVGSFVVDGTTTIKATNTHNGYGNSTINGILVNGGSFATNLVQIETYGVRNENVGISIGELRDTSYTIDKTASIKFNGGTITLNGGDRAAGLYAKAGEIISNGKLDIKINDANQRSYGIYTNGGNITVADTTIEMDGYIHTGIRSDAGKVTVVGDALIKSYGTAVYASGKNAIIDFERGFSSGFVNDNNFSVSDEEIEANEGSVININSTREGIVKFVGYTDNRKYNDGGDTEGTINMNLTNSDSYWNITRDSSLNKLEISNGAKLDMTHDYNYITDERLTSLKVENLTGSGGGIIYMDVDETNKTSDRIYIAGEHSGNQLIALIPQDAIVNIKDVVGTVVASEKLANNTGTFTAREEEGALFWEDYQLSKVDHTGGEGYAKDWIISGVTLDTDKPTTSVVTIMGANALNFHAWRGENGQLMRRMGELRLNGDDVEGAWFRMHGSKMSRNDNAAFENKYTSYELGYDQLTKNTDSVKRYTGAALSYTDGSSTYGSGSGENHSKAISFYNTDIYKSGHYLDLVFKYAQFDNDFDVFDTHGHEISGEYKNTGISVSAEYGRKNNLKEGWFIEPQAQLTLGYFAGDEYETSNGIKVDQSGIPSVLGRIGMSIGKEFNDNGVIYAKASLLHEFAGDYDITMSNTYSGGISRKESASFGDTWVEYGISAAFKTGKNNYFHFDLARATGADFDRDWMWNAGMRWTF